MIFRTMVVSSLLVLSGAVCAENSGGTYMDSAAREGAQQPWSGRGALLSGNAGGKLIRVAKQHNPANEATRCVQIQDSRNGANFYNSCNFAVELTWCVDGVDCNPGYSNTWTLGAGRQWPIQGTSKQRRQIYYAACKGANSFNHTSDLGRRKQHSCE